MESSKLDIWAIQHYPEEVENALNRITDNNSNVLFTNCISILHMSDRKFKIEFDTAFFSDKDDTLIVLMRGSKMTREEFIERLKRRNIGFSEVVFSDSKFKDYDEPLKEIWFARDVSVLEDAVVESKKKGISSCRYNPIMRGMFLLKYPLEESSEVLDFQELRGIVELEDKTIILINNLEDRNVYFKKALEVFSKLGITPIIENYESYAKQEKEKQKVKKRNENKVNGQS